jgi:hypothetical protein
MRHIKTRMERTWSNAVWAASLSEPLWDPALVLLEQRGEQSHGHPASVSTTFTLAVTATTRCHPTVKDLLRVCALVQPDTIPEELFRQGGEQLGVTLAAAAGDPLEWNRVMFYARGYSLLSRQLAGRTLGIHRLMQAVLLERMSAHEQTQ